MYCEKINGLLDFQLQHIAFKHFDHLSSYPNVTSPFSRMYLITKGAGKLTTGSGKVCMEENHIYLLPSFTPCTYVFQPGLSHIYINFKVSMKNGLNFFSLFSTNQKEKSSPFISCLFQRLLEINPGLELPHDDPKVYQNKPWINKTATFDSLKHHLETTSMIGQLLSNFINPEPPLPPTKIMRYNLQPILNFIQANLHAEITVDDLATMACFSKDHFTRIFKSILGIPPHEYLIRKRIEKAQALLVTSDLSQAQIMEETGIRNVSYFSRMFKKHTYKTPAEFRKQSWAME
ncbi:helix-turn-helix domain-containing protein [Lunatibacter salilacus]|uniref:helix-turn-helix domain-containing protein n=1 Tax=Lunatibacter salilacus TaxID=2483804 RepID=UPI00131B8344|nr:AraC family transcriptional regulator [Lunatibacter salilacus]